MSKKGLVADFNLSSLYSDLIAATEGASRVHITWSGVDQTRPNSSLLNITFYDIDGNVVKVCGGKLPIKFCIPKRFE